MRWTFLFATAALFALPSISRAQVAGFGGGSGLFEPEIEIVESGIVLDTQATVSADRKYVTMTFRAQNSQLLSLTSFAFQTGTTMTGVIGGGAGAGGAAPDRVEPQTSGGVNAPVTLAPGAGPRIMSQRGITPIVRN
ncbi:MAG TPA: hypothetical protein VEA69_18790 [Tepidisphaeraceae bacterium]|nr:hypothetical protein [Tepidisphaeraceae bacterium]